MERKRKLEVYEAPPAAANGAPTGGGIGYQQTAAPPAAAGGDINPYNGRTYSARYHQILATRQGERGAAWSPTVREHGSCTAEASAETSGAHATAVCSPWQDVRTCAAAVHHVCRSRIAAAAASARPPRCRLVPPPLPPCRPPCVAGQGRLHQHGKLQPDHHFGGRDRLRQDHPDCTGVAPPPTRSHASRSAL